MADAPIPEISWFATSYVVFEDRLRLACTMKSGEGDVLWLTQRLASVLVMKLLEWLDKQTVKDSRIAELEHRMAQQAATAKKPKKPAGEIPDGPGRLVHSVHFNTRENVLVLSFRDEAGKAACIRFNPDHLRRWLKVLHAQYRRSGWALEIWPDWMNEETAEQAPTHSGLLH